MKLALVALLAVAPAAAAPSGASAPSTSDVDPPHRFSFVRAFHGPQAWTDPVAVDGLRSGGLDAFAFWTPPDAGLADFLRAHRAPAIVTMAGAAHVQGLPADAIERQRASLAALRGASGLDLSWNLMEEWDQGGGRWVPGGRPRYAGLSRAEAHARFLRHYLDGSPPLGRYLREPRDRRGLPLVAQTDYAVNAQDAYAMGVDLCLLERGVDELGDLATGIAFVRGAARQHGRPWGIDLSVWRTGNASATRFDARGTLLGGWTPGYVRRHLYAAYLAGADVVQLEPAVTRGAGGAPNPLGAAVDDFADFALRRHRDVGRPAVTTALLVPSGSGFDPRHGPHDQAEAVWYRDIPWSDGDRMLDAVLALAYPGHRLHGLAPGAPFADAAGVPDAAAFQRFLAAGGDARPYEPTPTTRWGDALDVVTDAIPLEALRAYRAVALVGDVRLDARLRRVLGEWVREGGVLVVNARQATAADEALLGVRLGGVETGRSSRWLDDPGAASPEPAFAFTRVAPAGARVLAATSDGAPLVTVRALGRGRVVLATPHWLMPGSRDRLLGIGTRLLDWLHALDPAARVAGPPIQFTVGRAPGRTVVGLLNGTGVPWRGTVTIPAAGEAVRVREWVHDADVPHARSGADVVVRAAVAPYDVAVYAVEAP